MEVKISKLAAKQAALRQRIMIRVPSIRVVETKQERYANAVEAYARHHSVARTAAEVGCSTTLVYSALKAAGMQIAGNGERGRPRKYPDMSAERLAAKQEKIARRASLMQQKQEAKRARVERITARQLEMRQRKERYRVSALEYWYFYPEGPPQSVLDRYGVTVRTMRRRALCHLTNREFMRGTKHQAIALARFAPGATLDSVGQKYGLTRERVRQIVKASGLDLALLNQASALGRAPNCKDVTPVCSVNGKRTPEYLIFINMLRRCLNPRHPNYTRYGGRGVVPGPEWNPNVVGHKQAWTNFRRQMGKRPDGTQPSGRALYSLHRIDDALLYSKATCEWATQKEQCAEGQRRVRSAGKSHSKETKEKISAAQRARWANAKKPPQSVRHVIQIETGAIQ